jgi:hypothetical protein
MAPLAMSRAGTLASIVCVVSLVAFQMFLLNSGVASRQASAMPSAQFTRRARLAKPSRVLAPQIRHAAYMAHTLTSSMFSRSQLDATGLAAGATVDSPLDSCSEEWCLELLVSYLPLR